MVQWRPTQEIPISNAWPTDIRRGVAVQALLYARGGDSTWLRWLPRRVLAAWPQPQLDPAGTLKTLEAKFSDASVVNGVCPHWGFDLWTLPPDDDGTRTCPQHGLRWDADGRLVPHAAEMAETFRVGEAYVVDRLLRDGPVDPEYRAWAKGELAGRLRGPRAPLPSDALAGIEEQDLVADVEATPAAALPPDQALTKARRALEEAEAWADHARSVVGAEVARMKVDGHSPRLGLTLRPWSREWYEQMHLWERQQRLRDRIVRDIRVLDEAAAAAAR